MYECRVSLIQNLANGATLCKGDTHSGEFNRGIRNH